MISLVFVGVLGLLVNIVLVLGFMGLFYIGVMVDVYGVDFVFLFKILVGVVVINGIFEVIGVGIIILLLVKVLFVVMLLKLE